MKQPKLLLILIILLTFLIGILIGANLKSAMAEQWLYSMEQISCSQTDDYYTGKDFFKDLDSMRADFGKLAPIVTDDGVWDCEDTTHAIYCMAKHYDIKCQLYYQISYGRINNTEHVGLDCYINGRWEWMN
jgi:hypothetical protein